jgi:hypothetical protein
MATDGKGRLERQTVYISSGNLPGEKLYFVCRYRLPFPSVAKTMLLGLKNYTCGHYADGYKVG